MKPRLSLAVLLLVAPLGACELESTGPECSPMTLQQAGVRGDTVTLNTGARYLETQVGTGATAGYCDAVRIRYTGTLLNGNQFDTGTIDFALGFGELIPGFEQGVVGMKVGGRRRVIIPPQLGYGTQPRFDPNTGREVIPANSTLVFDLELVLHQEGED